MYFSHFHTCNCEIIVVTIVSRVNDISIKNDRFTYKLIQTDDYYLTLLYSMGSASKQSVYYMKFLNITSSINVLTSFMYELRPLQTYIWIMEKCISNIETHLSQWMWNWFVFRNKKFPSVHRDLPQPTPTEGKLATLVNVQSGVRRDCSRVEGMLGITLVLFSAHIYWWKQDFPQHIYFKKLRKKVTSLLVQN